MRIIAKILKILRGGRIQYLRRLRFSYLVPFAPKHTRLGRVKFKLSTTTISKNMQKMQNIVGRLQGSRMVYFREKPGSTPVLVLVRMDPTRSYVNETSYLILSRSELLCQPPSLPGLPLSVRCDWPTQTADCTSL